MSRMAGSVNQRRKLTSDSDNRSLVRRNDASSATNIALWSRLKFGLCPHQEVKRQEPYFAIGSLVRDHPATGCTPDRTFMSATHITLDRSVIESP